MIRWKATVAIAAIAALALTGCAGDGGDTSQGGEGGRADKLTLVAIASPTSYDIGQGAEWGNRSAFFEAVFDTVLHINSEGEVEPWLAESWEYNEDNTELTLKLRTDAKFSDGTPVDAEAVVASLEYFRDGSAPQAASVAGNEYSAPDASR